MRRLLAVVTSWAVLAATVCSLEAKSSRSAADDTETLRLNGIIQSPASDRRSKCQAVFTLFERYVKPRTRTQFSRVFSEPGWINESNIRIYDAVNGQIPIEWDPDHETLYEVSLFSDGAGSSDWVIYLTVNRAGLTRQDLVALLKGANLPSHADRIDEFGLCHTKGQSSSCKRFAG
jgi:hypothetical protein